MRFSDLALFRPTHPPLGPPSTHFPPLVVALLAGGAAQVLPNDVAARKQFVASGGLQRIQEITAEPGSKLKEAIDAVNSCYPEEVVRYYSPGYSHELMQKIEEYQPA